MRNFIARILAKMKLAIQSTKSSHYLCRSPHTSFLDDGRSPDVSRWMIGRIADARSCEGTRSMAVSSNYSWRVPQVCKMHASSLVANFNVNDARHWVSERLIALSCDINITMVHSQLLAAVQARWQSFRRFGSSQLPWNHLHGAVFTFFLRVSHTPIKFSGKEKEGSCPIACAISPCIVVRYHSLRNESIYLDRSPRPVGFRGPEVVSQ